MKPHRQIVNPEQQPGRRHYRREHDRYYHDEERDFGLGADYIPQNRPAYDNVGLRQDQEDWRRYSDTLYIPSRDYGRDYNDDYSPRNKPKTSGYGNQSSSQSRDFEHWLHDDKSYRNYPEKPRLSYPDWEFPEHRVHNRNFEEGLYDYGHARENRQERAPDFYRHELPRINKWHNHSDRHLEIVVPFKNGQDYGRNYYNESEGFGRYEMVYPSGKPGVRGSWPYEL